MLSIITIVFVINIASINTMATEKVQDLLLRTKKEVLSESSDRTMSQRNEDVIYLSAMAEQLASSRNRYSITIFSFIIDNAFVSKIVMLLATQAFAALAAFVKKDLSND